MDREQRVYFRNMFREARAAALADAEGFQEILFAIERLGCLLLGRQGDLGVYEDRILAFLAENGVTVAASSGNGVHSSIRTLYGLVRDARNSALHQGAFARQLTTHSTELALAIESALTHSMSQIGDYAVLHPICASAWHPVRFVRQTMLANSFSFLPINVGTDSAPDWQLISDVALASYIRKPGTPPVKDRLQQPVGDVIRAAWISPVQPYTCATTTDVHEALSCCHGIPILVVAPGGALLGIATPFDLL